MVNNTKLNQKNTQYEQKNSYVIKLHKYQKLSLKIEKCSINLFLNIKIIVENLVLGIIMRSHNMSQAQKL